MINSQLIDMKDKAESGRYGDTLIEKIDICKYNIALTNKLIELYNSRGIQVFKSPFDIPEPPISYQDSLIERIGKKNIIRSDDLEKYCKKGHKNKNKPPLAWATTRLIPKVDFKLWKTQANTVLPRDIWWNIIQLLDFDSVRSCCFTAKTPCQIIMEFIFSTE